MKRRSGKAFRATAAVNCGWLLLMLGLVPLMFPPSGWSQEDEAEVSEDSSKHVEESEEAYRRRMELEEARDRADVIPDRSAGSLKAPEGMDALPPESRKHLRDELRNIIIEQGEWQPEDVNVIYPYNPSAAAQKDPELRKQEGQAWGELIQEYHKREAAALQAGGARSSGSSPGAGSSAASGQAGANSSEKSKSASPDAHSTEMRAETAATSSTAAGAGVSQSALEFLKGQANGHTNGQSGGQSGGRSGGMPGKQAGSPAASKADSQSSAQRQASSASTAASAAQKSAEKSPYETQQQVAEATGSRTESSSNAKEQSGNPPPPPGSLAIAELRALEEGRKRKEAENQQSGSQKAEHQAAQSEKTDQPSAESQQSTERAHEKQTSQATDDNSADSKTQSIMLRNEAEQPPPPPPPGTIAIPELEKLQGLESDAPPALKKP